MSDPIEPQPPHDNSAAAPGDDFQARATTRNHTFFDTVFIGQGGVRAGWRAGVFASLLVVLGSAGQLAVSALGLAAPVNARDLEPWPIFLQETMFFLATLGAAAMLALVEGRSISGYGLPWKRAFRAHFWQGAVWGFCEISILVVLIAGLGGYFLGRVALGSAQALGFGCVWLAVFLMVALSEEFAFRGYLLTTLSSGMGFWPASIVLSLMFGAAHIGNPGENWAGLLTVFVVGMFFCLTVRRTGDLWFAVGAHAAFDFGQAFLYGAPNSGTVIRGALVRAAFSGPAWLTGGAAGPEGSYLAFVVLGLLFVLFAAIYDSDDAPRVVQEQQTDLPKL